MATSNAFRGAVEIMNITESRFTNAEDGDMVIYPKSSTQSLHLGVRQGQPSMLKLAGNNLTVNADMNVTGTISQNGAIRIDRFGTLSNINVYSNSYTVNIDASRLTSGTLPAARFPQGTLNTAGVVRLSAAINTASNVAATPSAVKVVYDLASNLEGRLNTYITSNINASNIDAQSIVYGIVNPDRLPIASTSTSGVVILNDNTTYDSTNAPPNLVPTMRLFANTASDVNIASSNAVSAMELSSLSLSAASSALTNSSNTATIAAKAHTLAVTASNNAQAAVEIASSASNIAVVALATAITASNDAASVSNIAQTALILGSNALPLTGGTLTGPLQAPELHIGNKLSMMADSMINTNHEIAGLSEVYLLSICWSPDTMMYVAVGVNYGNNMSSLIVSRDGKSWQLRNIFSNLYSVCWSPYLSMFVAVGENIVVSSNGLTWTSIALPVSSDSAKAVCWSNELSIFVAVMGSGNVLTSANGLQWETHATGLTTDWRCVCWSPELGKFVAGGYGSPQAMSSEDGMTWTSILISNVHLNRLSYILWIPNISLFVANDSYKVFLSNDGSNWTSTFTSPTKIGGMAWAAERNVLLLLGYGVSTSYTSSNAISWTSFKTATNSWYGTCWSPQHESFVSVSDDTPSEALVLEYTNSIAVSSLHVSDTIGLGKACQINADVPARHMNVSGWTQTNTPNRNFYSCVCWSATLSLFVAVSQSGTQNRVMTSFDGITWISRSTPAGGDLVWQSVCWSPELAIFVITGSAPYVMVSTDGMNWSLHSAAIMDHLCWSPDLNLFVGVSGAGVVVSSNGLSWSRLNVGYGYYSICWSPEKRIFATCGATKIGTSVDGIVWVTRMTLPFDAYHAICWSPELSIFVAVGRYAQASSTATALCSDDGISWTSYSINSTSTFRRIIWSSELMMFIAVSDGVVNYFYDIISSFDGKTWNVFTPFSRTTHSSLCWSPELMRLVTVGYDGFASIAYPNALTLHASSITNGQISIARLPKSTTARPGIVQLSDSTSNNTSTTAATSRAVKQAYSLAIQALSTAESSNIDASRITGILNNSNLTLASTTAEGIVQLSDSTSANSSTTAATSLAVKTAYDHATTALTTAQSKLHLTGGTLTGPLTVPKLHINLNAIREDVVVSWATQQTPFTGIEAWMSICWSPEKALYAAVSKRPFNPLLTPIMTSSDGYTWTSQTVSDETVRLQSVCWSPQLSLFVAVSDAKTGRDIVISSDGLVWTTVSTPEFNGIYIAWSSDLALFVAVSEFPNANSVMVSNDGVQWSTHATGYDKGLWIVRWIPEMSVFVAAGETILKSVDGIIWSEVSNPNVIQDVFMNDYLSDLLWAPEFSLFVAICTRGIFTSQDGCETWTQRYVVTVQPEERLVCGVWSKQLASFFVVGWDGIGLQSTDGVHWKRMFFPVSKWTRVCWAPELNQLVAVSASLENDAVMIGMPTTHINIENLHIGHHIKLGEATHITADSPPMHIDVSGWSYYPTFPHGWACVTWASSLGVFVAVAMFSQLGFFVSTSTDGETWVSQSTPNTDGWSSICWSPELELLVVGSSNAIIMTSSDAVNWSSHSVPHSIQAICWSPELALFVTDKMISSNGITWETHSMPGVCYSICWSPEKALFVGVTSTGVVYTSADGITWTTHVCPMNNWTSVCWSSERSIFLAVSSESITNDNDCVMTSSDGRLWTTQSLKAAYWKTVVWAPEISLFLAVSYGQSLSYNGLAYSATSPDGVTWKLQALNGLLWQAACWSPEMMRFVCVGVGATIVSHLNNLTLHASSITNGQISIARLPKSTTVRPGIVQLSDSTSNISSTSAATSLAVKTAYDRANQAYATAQTSNIDASRITGMLDNAHLNVATTLQQGIVQLTDSTSTTSSTLAATATAVKDTYNLAFSASNQATHALNTAQTSNIDATRITGMIDNALLRTATTIQQGIVQLTDSTSMTSSTLAATATAVKTAYDLAADAINTARTSNVDAMRLTGGIIDNVLLNKATTTLQGIVQLTDSTSTTSSVLAATATAVKAAYDLAFTASNQALDALNTAQTSNIDVARLMGTIDNALLTTATTTQRGIVQLTDSTSTTSSTLAATATAVKDTYDLAIHALNTATSSNVDALRLTGTIDNARLNTASTSQPGIVQLSDSTTTLSSTLAATATAVKTVADTADAALPRSGGVMTGPIAGFNGNSSNQPAFVPSSLYPQTGIYALPNDQIGFATNGAPMLLLNPSGGVLYGKLFLKGLYISNY